jgi:hypothetical protein
MKKLLSASLISFSAIALPASATCTIATPAGLWNAYTASRGTKTLNYTRCTLTIDRKGGITGVCTVTDDQGTHLPQAHATGSLRLTGSSFCTFAGLIQLDNGWPDSNIGEATLSIDRQTAYGVGNTAQANFTLSMIKIR